MERSQIILWEFPLVVGSQGYEELVTQDYVRDVVVSNLRDLLDPGGPRLGDRPPEGGRGLWTALAQYYSSFGSSHPSAVTYAALYEARVYQQAASGLCAAITLAVDPVEANNIYWQSAPALIQDQMDIGCTPWNTAWNGRRTASGGVQTRVPAGSGWSAEIPR